MASFDFHIDPFVRVDNFTKGVFVVVIKHRFLFRPIVIVAHEILSHLPEWADVHTRANDNELRV